jgi:signal transduction histidine kinase
VIYFAAIVALALVLGGCSVVLVLTRRNLTARRQAEAALRAAHEELKTIYDNAPVLLIVVDEHLRVRKANGMAQRFAGLGVEQMRGLRPGGALGCLNALEDPQGCGYGPSCLQCPIRLAVLDTVRHGARHEHVEASLPFLVEGERRPRCLLVSTAPVEFEQRRRALICLQDVTELKQAEENVRRLNNELEKRVHERTAQLEATNKELEAFAYSVSHDLRAPLRGINGWGVALAEDYAGQLDERAAQYVDRLRVETQRMGLLIDDLLQLSRITRAEIQRETVDVSAIANDVAARLQEANSGRQIRFDIRPGLTTVGDPRLLEIALTNLLGNAVKFTGPRSLANQAWDAIIADYHLPGFDAPGALAVLRETGLDIPFVVVSGAIGEDVAVSMMKAGAHDYVLKNNLLRLVPAVEREIGDARVRRERRQAEAALRQAQKLESIGLLAGGIAHEFKQNSDCRERQSPFGNPGSLSGLRSEICSRSRGRIRRTGRRSDSPVACVCRQRRVCSNPCVNIRGRGKDSAAPSGCGGRKCRASRGPGSESAASSYGPQPNGASLHQLDPEWAWRQSERTGPG